MVAAAGTGKTSIIAERFRRLVKAGLEPDRVLVMTFTERAAAEMRERILATGIEAAANVGTFHSMAQRWLREEGARIGVRSQFRILAGPDRWILLRELMWELGAEELVGADRPDDQVTPLLKLQERLKQELIPVARLRAWAEHSRDHERAEFFLAATDLFAAYERRCRKEGLLDFDDLIFDAVRLLESSDGFRRAFAARFGSVLVDEYQDTNLAQEKLVELLAKDHGNVLAVGDDDQSIYRFRGASRASMERFLTVFPGAETVTLGRNRRSSRRIVAAATALISNNPDRIEKVMTGSGAAGPKPRVWHCESGEAEAGAIAHEVAALLGAGCPGEGVAILTRTNAGALPIARALAGAGIRFQLRSPHGFYHRPEVRDVRAFLRVLHDPLDLIALARAAAAPPLRIRPQDTVARVRAAAAEGPDPLSTLRTWKPAARWAETMLDLRQAAGTLGVDELLFELLSRTAYLEHALAGADSAAEAARIEQGVTRFAELVDQYCERHPDHSLRAFSERLELVLLSGVEEEGADAYDPDPVAVQLMTIHQAKGLEFEAVFLPALVEGKLPQPRRRDRFALPSQVLEPAVRGREDQVAEERRLCYVAATRARRRLYLSWADRYDGGREWAPSRFLAELEAGMPGVREEWIPDAGAVDGQISDPARDAARAPAGAAPVGPALSFSSISAYRECPRQFEYRYRLRLPAARTVEGEYGTLMHEVLRRLALERQAGRALDGVAVEAIYSAAWAVATLPDERRRPALERLGRAQLARYLEAGGLAEAPSDVEVSFTTTLDSWRLTGIIDRIEHPPPTLKGGEVGGSLESAAPEAGRAPWRIVDYKTGTPLPASRLRRDLQLLLYALGARHALGLDPVELEIVYLRDGRTVSLTPDEEMLAAAREIVNEVAAGVAALRFEPRPERRRCRLCSYRLLCEEAL